LVCSGFAGGERVAEPVGDAGERLRVVVPARISSAMDATRPSSFFERPANSGTFAIRATFASLRNRPGIGGV
jgi:hypothetical protein